MSGERGRRVVVTGMAGLSPLGSEWKVVRDALQAGASGVTRMPTRNLEHPDERCAPLDHVQGGPRALRADVAVSNNFAFGGVNTSLVFRPWSEG